MRVMDDKQKKKRLTPTPQELYMFLLKKFKVRRMPLNKPHVGMFENT